MGNQTGKCNSEKGSICNQQKPQQQKRLGKKKWRC